jgi:hypothetical protein
VGGFELFVTLNSTNINVSESSFQGIVSAFNITEGANHEFRNLTFVDHTYGLRVQGVSGLTVDGLVAGLGISAAYQPPLAPPTGTAIQVNGTQFVSIGRLNLTGDAGRPFPRQLGGFVITDSNDVLVRQCVGSGGDTFGDVTNAFNVVIEGVSLTSFSSPLTFGFVNGLAIREFSMDNSSSGIELHNVGNWVVEGAFAATIGAPVILATNLTGSGTIGGLAATTSVGMAILNWSGAGSFSAHHLAGTDLSFGVELQAQDLGPVRINDSVFERVSTTMIAFETTLVHDLVLSNLTFDVIGDWVVNVTSGEARRFYMVDLHGGLVGDGLVGIGAVQADNLTFAAINVTNLTGPLLQVHLSGTGDALFGFSLASLNSTGSLVDLEAPVVRRTVLTGLEVVTGELAPPPLVPAAVTVASTQIQDLVIDGVNINSSNRNGILVSASRGTGVRIANVSVQGLPAWGVMVAGTATNWSLEIQNVTGLSIDGPVVLVSGVEGSISVTGVYATNSTVGVQLSYSARARLQGLTTRGGGAGVVLLGSQNVTVQNVSADTGIGLEVVSCTDVVVDGASLRGSLWALRASSSSNVTVLNLDAVNTTGGVSLRDVSNSRVVGADLEFTGIGVQVSLFSRNVTVQGPTLTTPADGHSRNPLEVSYATGISITGLRFVGACDQALVVFASTQVNITDFGASACLSGLAISG